MSSTSVSAEHFPLVIIEINAEVTGAYLDEVGATFREIFARRKKFVVISDVRGLQSLPDAKTRQMVANWWKEMAPDQRIWNLGSVNIVSSAPVRGALTALTWLFAPPTPQAYVSDMTSALDWAAARLAEADLALPASAEVLRATA